jgi:hypothetical protein
MQRNNELNCNEYFVTKLDKQIEETEDQTEESNVDQKQADLENNKVNLVSN